MTISEERAQKICELLKIVLVGLACPFALPLIEENGKESQH